MSLKIAWRKHPAHGVAVLNWILQNVFALRYATVKHLAFAMPLFKIKAGLFIVFDVDKSVSRWGSSSDRRLCLHFYRVCFSADFFVTLFESLIYLHHFLQALLNYNSVTF